MDIADKVLEGLRVEKEQAVPTARAAAEEASRAKEAQEQATQAAQDEGETTQKASAEAKSALAEVAQKFQTAKEALQQLKTKQIDEDKELLEASSAKDILERLLKHIPGQHERGADIPEISEFLQQVKAHLEIDTTMMSALSLALAKAPETRGTFDQLTVQELQEKGARKITELTEVITNGEPAKAARQAAVAAAEEALQAAKAQQIASAHGYTKASDGAAAADQAYTEAKKALTDSVKTARKAARDFETAQVLFDIFKDGPLEDFRKLRERLTPEEEASEAPPEAMDEGVEVLPQAVPVAA